MPWLGAGAVAAASIEDAAPVRELVDAAVSRSPAPAASPRDPNPAPVSVVALTESRSGKREGVCCRLLSTLMFLCFAMFLAVMAHTLRLAWLSVGNAGSNALLHESEYLVRGWLVEWFGIGEVPCCGVKEYFY